MFPEFLTGIFRTKRTILNIPVACTKSDLAAPAPGKQPAVFRTAPVTIGNFLGSHLRAVDIQYLFSNGYAHL
jgi:hypothetical protein